ncbi:MAG: PilZ domain-containing protein [Deltaproteobacteria bacterium]|nr:PilZ domain-containing protein [Deltaproteobacteria bacterium]
MTEGADRRQHARVPYGAWVTLKAGKSKSFCLARDLSLGGVFLRSQKPPPMGSKVQLVLVVEGEREPIKLKAHVVRQSEAEGGFAVRFDSMSEEAAAHLLTLVQAIHRQLEAALNPPLD